MYFTFHLYDCTIHCRSYQVIIREESNTNNYWENAKKIKKINTRNPIKINNKNSRNHPYIGWFLHLIAYLYMKVGIIGLPNVGKSSLFKALTKKQVDIANFPFCTIGPNVGIVKVPDERLDKLSMLSNSQNIIPAAVEFVDIAGLVRGAHEGEGLGNQFLSHVREVDALVHVVRVFRDENIIHVEGDPDPLRDIETINLELIFADSTVVEKRITSLKNQLKSGSKLSVEQILTTCERIFEILKKGLSASQIILTEEEEKGIKDLALLTRKPIVYVFNTNESGTIEVEFEEKLTPYIPDSLAMCIKIEAEISELNNQEIEELGMKSTGLDALIVKGYTLLNLITFFTTGPKETRAWTIQKESKAPQAAGVIHTDFERGFICAEVINWKNLLDAGGEVRAKERGLIRKEGKEYTMQDGDVCVFRFSV